MLGDTVTSGQLLALLGARAEAGTPLRVGLIGAGKFGTMFLSQARRAATAGVVYSLAYGDQPALICELVEWARACGFDVACAGKGTKYLPIYHASTPDTVWEHYGFTPEMVAQGDYNPRMFNSFLDGTKSAIEMAAVANATGLLPQDEGLQFHPCGVDDMPSVCRRSRAGG